jgi:membrane fusion protein (multidrug efflux system)
MAAYGTSIADYLPNSPISAVFSTQPYPLWECLMSTTFSRSMRALQGDRSGGTNRMIAVAIVLLALWAGWFLFAEVPIYEQTDSARIEVNRAASSIESPIAGRIVAIHVALGTRVKTGDLLLELDSETEQRQLEEEEARLLGVTNRITALRAEMASRRRGQAGNSRTMTTTIEEAQAEYDAAETAARFAEEQSRRMKMMKEGNVAELDLQRVESEARQKRSAAEARRVELLRLKQQQQTEQDDRQVDIDRLTHDITVAESDAATARITISRLGQEIERHRIRAEADGTIGQLARLSVGSVIGEGEQIGAIVPSGELKVIADFSPASAFGHIRRGQPALMRLAGFPWTQYGSIPARVNAVGSELRDGQVRVELAIDGNTPSAVPLQHGLPGTVEVEVERLSPALLVLRTVGRLFQSESVALNDPARRESRK